MDVQGSRTLPWRYQDLDFAGIDRTLIVDDEDAFFILCGPSFVESGAELYAANLAALFGDDRAMSDWLRQRWVWEELQHGQALRAYIRVVWPDFDWDHAFQRFLEEYARRATSERLEKTHALEMVSRCVVETGTATLYRAIATFVREPVLRDFCERICADEVRHYKQFYEAFRRYNRVEGHGRRRVLGALLRRLSEIRNDDSEIALRHAHAVRYRDAAMSATSMKAMVGRLRRIVRLNLPADMCVKMLLKPLDLPPRIQPAVYSTVRRFSQHVFLRA